MKRIVCVGNRYAAADAAGPKVYDCLADRTLPDDVEVIDGGLGGLNLLGCLEGAERVVFVDTVSGYAEPNAVVVLDAAEAAGAAGNRYDHVAGLDYLLRVVPNVCRGAMPEIRVVGVEKPFDDRAVATAADLSLAVACATAQAASVGDLHDRRGPEN